jgi:outer membrane protein OmpA-like peptidoglycan-associated protein
MKLNYKLRGNRLEGNNDITIKKLQLGEKIKSEQAKDLPLGLAIALLSDANGVIQMNLKVKGNLDQPDFSLGNIFWDVLSNTLSKAITSPFSLLASLAGGTEDLDELLFLPGEPDLTPTQQTKLAKLAQALKERPRLSMNIRGKVNFNEERPILQRQKLERALAKITGAPVDLSLLEQDPVLQAALAEAYEARFNEDLGDLADRLKLDKSSPALRAQAEILLRDQQLITTKSLRNLAMRRAQNTKEYLVDTQGIAPERLFVLDSQVRETDKEAKVVLTLDD